MAQTPFSLLLLRRLTLSSQNPRPPLLPCLLKHFSTSQPSPSSSFSSEPPPKPSSLSARLSFVFDQIDAIEKQQHQILSQKDETLQRIRAWRQSRKPQTVSHSDPEPESSRLGSALDGNDKDAANSSPALEVAKDEDKRKKPVMEVVHPWPEWIEFIERLVGQNYFDHRRKDDDRLVQELGIDEAEVAAGDDDVRFDLTKDFKAVQTACINFGKDRFDILRSLSRQDIQILVGFGCPSAEKKVVFSAKLLRKRVHLDEGDVCSSCSLRNSCERAYLLTNKEDEARTIDVMRVLFTFGFDPLNGSVANEALLKQKSIKNVVRKLLHEVVKLSAVPIDPNLPPPVIKRPPPKVKQPPPPPKKRVGRDDIEMKKGDWLCPKCDFLNFAKNTVCLQCDAKRPKRQLLPGEWECPECNFLNYRRNMVCFHCECKRPQDEFMENKMQEKQHGPRTRLEKIAHRQEVSNAWNFDFDDNESDGADVAAFEHADPSMMAGDYPLDNQSHEGKFRGPEGSFNKVSRVPRVHEKEYSDGDTNRVGMGFDDFDDEEDDIDSYELETHHNSSGQKPSSKDFSEEEYSGMEDFEGTNDNMPARGRTYSPSYKPSKSMRVNAAFSGSEGDGLDLDSDEDLSVHPNWKSSHVADSRQGARGKGQGPSKRLSFGSDEEPGLYSDVDDDLVNNFKSRQSGNKLVYGKRDFGRKRSSYMKDDLFSGPELDDDENLSSRKQKKSQGRANHNSTRDTKYGSGGRMGSRRNSFSDDFDERGSQRSHGNNRGSHNTHRANHKSARDTKYGSSGRMGGRRNSFSDDFDERSQGSRGNNQGSYKNHRDGCQKRDRGADTRNFKAHGREDRFGKQQRGRLNEYDRDGDRDFGEFRNSRRVIER